MTELQNLEEIAKQGLSLAREYILSHFQNHNLSVEWKADATPVTIADKGAEEKMREFFSKELPGCGFVGEEFGFTDGSGENGDLFWIMDPIDGTKSFIHGVPLFGTLLSLQRKTGENSSESLFGAIDMCALNSQISALKGQGAFLDGKKIEVSSTQALDSSLVLSGTLNTMEDLGYGEQFKNLRHSSRLYRGWGDCYGYYLVATGRAEVMVDPVVSSWDIAPMSLIFEESGGKFSTIRGEEELFFLSGDMTPDKYTGVASNGILHPEVLEILCR